MQLESKVPKQNVLVKGRIVRMTDAAFKIASKHFGARKNKVDDNEIPFELGRLPKLDIVSALKEIKPVEVKPVEVKAEEAKPLEVAPVEVTLKPKVTRKRK